MMAIIESDPSLTYIYDILDNVFLVFPHFCLGRGLIEMSIQQLGCSNEIMFRI